MGPAETNWADRADSEAGYVASRRGASRGNSLAPMCTAKSMASAGERSGSVLGGVGRLVTCRACSYSP